ncbi:MAG TPA: hypothetical protein VIG57_16625, partial [Candidatus Entotheonella sp.]
VVNITGDITLTSIANVNAKAIGGAAAAAQKAGVGLTITNIINWDAIRAFIGKSATVTSGGTISLRADADQELTTIAVSAAGADKAGVAGVFAVIFTKNVSKAFIGDSAIVKADDSILLTATNDTKAFMVAGGAAGAATAGVGGSLAALVIWNDTLAYIGQNAITDAKNATSLEATASELAITAVISGTGGGNTGVAASLSTKTIKSNTQAYIGQSAQVNLDPLYASANQTVSLAAIDASILVGVAGSGTGGGTAGVGASSDINVITKTVNAFIANAAQVSAVKLVSILAKAAETIISITAGFAGGGNTGVGGAVAILVVANSIQAFIGDAATVFSNGNVLLEALSDLVSVMLVGSGAGGGTAGVGGSLGVSTIISTVLAYIGQNAHVTALGNGDLANVFTGAAGKGEETARGLSLAAYSTEIITMIVVSGSGGGSAGVAASVGANVIKTTTEAFIKPGALINETNTGAHADQEVRLVAVDETVLTTIVGGGSGGGSAGVGAASDTGVLVKTTRAYIGNNASVNANKDIFLSSLSQDVHVSTTAGFGGGGSAGIGGAVSVSVIANTTESFTGSTVRLNSQNNITLFAADYATMVL